MFAGQLLALNSDHLLLFAFWELLPVTLFSNPNPEAKRFLRSLQTAFQMSKSWFADKYSDNFVFPSGAEVRQDV